MPLQELFVSAVEENSRRIGALDLGLQRKMKLWESECSNRPSSATLPLSLSLSFPSWYGENIENESFEHFVRLPLNLALTEPKCLPLLVYNRNDDSELLRFKTAIQEVVSRSKYSSSGNCCLQPTKFDQGTNLDFSEVCEDFFLPNVPLLPTFSVPNLCVENWRNINRKFGPVLSNCARPFSRQLHQQPLLFSAAFESGNLLSAHLLEVLYEAEGISFLSGGRESPYKLKDNTCFESLFSKSDFNSEERVLYLHYELLLNYDTHTLGHTQWYNFAVRVNSQPTLIFGKGYAVTNDLKKETIPINYEGRLPVPIEATFSIVNLRKKKSCYEVGMQPYIFSRRSSELGCSGSPLPQWRTGLCKGGRYFPNGRYVENTIPGVTGNSEYTYQFTYRFEYIFDTVHFAMYAPLTYSYMRRFMRALKTHPQTASYVYESESEAEFGSSIGGIQVPLMYVSNFELEPFPTPPKQILNHVGLKNLKSQETPSRSITEPDSRELSLRPSSFTLSSHKMLLEYEAQLAIYSKKCLQALNNSKEKKTAIVIIARQHSGEVGGSWILQGFMKYLLGSSPEARVLRNRFIFHIVPMVNVDGVIYGNSRCTLAGVDPNRQWAEPTPIMHPIIFRVKEHIRKIQDGEGEDSNGCSLFLDLHGHSQKTSAFFYGCGNNDIRSAVYPKLVSLATSDLAFDECRYRFPKSQNRTARHVAYKQLGVKNAYTLEASFFGREPPTNNSEAAFFEVVFTPTRLESLGAALGRAMIPFFKLEASVSRFLLGRPSTIWNPASLDCQEKVDSSCKALIKTAKSVSSYSSDSYLNASKQFEFVYGMKKFTLGKARVVRYEVIEKWTYDTVLDCLKTIGATMTDFIRNMSKTNSNEEDGVSESEDFMDTEKLKKDILLQRPSAPRKIRKSQGAVKDEPEKAQTIIKTLRRSRVLKYEKSDHLKSSTHSSLFARIPEDSIKGSTFISPPPCSLKSRERERNGGKKKIMICDPQCEETSSQRCGKKKQKFPPRAVREQKKRFNDWISRQATTRTFGKKSSVSFGHDNKIESKLIYESRQRKNDYSFLSEKARKIERVSSIEQQKSVSVRMCEKERTFSILVSAGEMMVMNPSGKRDDLKEAGIGSTVQGDIQSDEDGKLGQKTASTLSVSGVSSLRKREQDLKNSNSTGEFRFIQASESRETVEKLEAGIHLERSSSPFRSFNLPR